MIADETQIAPVGGDVVQAVVDAEGIVTITMLRGESYNTMTVPLLDELLECVEWAADPGRAQAIILTGTGRAFCAGGDLNEIASPGEREPRQEVIERLNRHAGVSVLLRESAVPSIAAINGACAGAGLAVACAADVRIAVDGAKFRTAFLTAGLSGDFGGSWTLPRLLGDSRARELFLLNPKFDAARALELGLVAEVLAPELLLTRARQIAGDWVTAGSDLVTAIKANLNESGGVDFCEHLPRESERHIALSYASAPPGSRADL